MAAVALLAVTSLPTVGLAAAGDVGDDEWADDCYVQGPTNDARTDARTLDAGIYKGTLSATDVDAFFVDPDENGTVRLNVTYRGDADSYLYVRTYDTNDTRAPNTTVVRDGTVVYAYDGEFLLRPGTAVFDADADARFCVFLRTGNIPGEWTVKVTNATAGNASAGNASAA